MSGLLAVDDVGRGEPLVLIHGLATTRRIWEVVAPVLAARRRVVTLDVPGFGESAPAGPGFELEAVALRIARGLAARGVRAPYDVVGHSLGAGIAVTLAAMRPRSVRRLVLVAPAGLAVYPAAASAALAAGADGLLAARRRVGALADLRWGRRVLLGLVAADGANVTPTQARLMIDASAGATRTATALATITRANLMPLLRETKMPLGVLWGTDDRTVPARNVDLVRRSRPDARVVMIERAGHVPMIERSEAFVAMLERLLDSLDKDITTRAAAGHTLP